MKCHFCARRLRPEQPVWRLWYPKGEGGVENEHAFVVRPICRRCFGVASRGVAGSLRTWYVPEPCVSCGRMVTNQFGMQNVRHAFTACSRECWLKAYAARRERVPVARRPRRCDGCGRTYTPRRCDGRYCSASCRVRTWRAA